MDLIDIVMQCPYDKNHKIAKSRIQRHLVKCEKNFPPGYKVICPYNATHRFFKDELQNHVQECPDRIFTDPSIYMKSCTSSISTKAKVVLDLAEDGDENWDHDNDIGDEYDNFSVFEEAIIDPRVPEWIKDISKLKMDIDIHQSGRSPSIRSVNSELSCPGVGRGAPIRRDSEEVNRNLGLGRASLLKRILNR